MGKNLYKDVRYFLLSIASPLRFFMSPYFRGQTVWKELLIEEGSFFSAITSQKVSVFFQRDFFPTVLKSPGEVLKFGVEGV